MTGSNGNSAKCRILATNSPPMFFLYNLLVHASELLLKMVAPLSVKLTNFTAGRKDVFGRLAEKITDNDRVIWFHAASLGEFEQGLPVMEKVKAIYPEHKILLTFFSPSGYEVRKNNTVADLTLYLPLDTARNASRFVELANPQLVFFIKYEFWPNYLWELKVRKVPTYLISGIFRENQAFFKWYGGFYRQALDTFTHFFVQNQKSKEMLLSLGKSNVTISGDTRFDRVSEILERENHLEFMDRFCDGKLTLVAGSTWPKDEAILVDYINKSDGFKCVIAPHNINADQIEKLRQSVKKKVILYSEMASKQLEEYDVLIVDTIGLLTKIYSYAGIAYVGGGFGKPGVHNVLEPAVFGIPVVFGPNYSHFAEATALVENSGCISIQDGNSLTQKLDVLMNDPMERAEQGHICGTFVKMNKGATAAILKHLQYDRDQIENKQ